MSLDARKSWVTSAAAADSYVWSSRPLQQDAGMTLWLVPSTSAGLAIAGSFDGLGLRGNGSNSVGAVGFSIPCIAVLRKMGLRCGKRSCRHRFGAGRFLTRTTHE